MNRIFSPYEKNQLIKYKIDQNFPDSNQTPIEYLTGHAEFNGLDFLIDQNVLIPRVETEEILTLVSKYLSPKTFNLKPLLIVDLGCGSGALGISLSHQLIKRGINHQLYLSDLSSQALKVAQENSLRLLPPDHQPILIQSDLLNLVPTLKIDLLLANLPYVPSNRISTLDPSVKDYEPHLALDGGSDGSVLINRLLKQIGQLSSPPALVILEIDHTHQLKNFSLPQNYQAKIKKDQFGYHRFLVLLHTLL